MLDEMLAALRQAWLEIRRDVWYFVQRVILRRTFLPAPSAMSVVVDLRKR